MMKRFPPFSYVSSDDENLQGFSVDLFKLLAEKTGLEFKFETGFWAENLSEFKNNEVDLISGISYKEERTRYTYYTEPYYKIPLVVYIRKDNNWYQTSQDLSNKKIGVTKDVYYKDTLRQELGSEIVGMKNNEQLLKALAYEEIDAVITNLSIGNFYVQKNVLQNIKLAGEYNSSQLTKEDLRIGIQKEKPVILKDIIEKGLNAITETEWTRLKKKWIDNAVKRDNNTINLTSREKKFVEQREVIKVGIDKNWPPFAYTVGSQSFGLSVDLINELADKLGIEIKYVNGSWNELLHKLRERKIDVLPSAYKTENRQQFALYTTPYYNSRTVFITRTDTTDVSKIEQLYGKVVAVPKGWAYEEYLRTNHPQVKLLAVNNMKDAFLQLEQKTADAVIGYSATVKYFLQKNLVTDIKVAGKFKSYEQDKFRKLHFMVRDDWPILHRMLEKSLASISPAEMVELEEKWVQSKEEEMSYLTAEERKYLEDKEQITMSVNPKWMPFEKINEQGGYEGTVARFFELLEEQLKVEINVKETESWQKSLERTAAGKSDIVSTAVKPRDENLAFTESYVDYPFVIATRQDEIYVSNLRDLQNKKIGLSKGCPLFEVVQEKYPQIDFVKVKNSEVGLEKVQDSELFGMVNTAPRLGYIIQQKNMFDLKISGELAAKMDLRIGVNPEDEMLLNILNKAMQQVEQEKKKELFNNWLTIRYQERFNYSLLFKILAGIGVIGLFILYRQYELKKFNQKLRSLNQKLAEANNKLKNMSYIDGLTQIPNRRKFDEILEKEWKHCKREQYPLSLIMLDLDFFKEFNDRYGHLAGDDCLKQIAETLEEYVNRPRDLVARYGGEEFIVILPETKAQGAKQVGEKIQQAVIDLKIEHKDSKVASYVTVSLGVSTVIPHDDISRDDFVDAVDQAMYQAKQNGRNQIKVKKL
ncbi:transporter substrate-binding domain-containing protein [Halanaerobacter jeridensis]|uniref:Diguanylate cyclase (GGDEF)-like protein n=1 Tax=Halanaerobacter jeridensis TaxID=706427 RepID=A0A938XV71_9FIRM|nr:transporter substrate-binding domain-containing protein [Halanaerobacter jeridensis]MBM7557449.1 diguanylate cyclase (GGDEF)-like protein [Halanaerobacter jeridensis]